MNDVEQMSEKELIKQIRIISKTLSSIMKRQGMRHPDSLDAKSTNTLRRYLKDLRDQLKKVQYNK